jgi:hypothetical protein
MRWLDLPASQQPQHLQLAAGQRLGQARRRGTRRRAFEHAVRSVLAICVRRFTGLGQARVVIG